MAIMPSLNRQALLRAYYKGDNNTLHKLATEIGIDPEGVTEEDVARASHEVYKHLEAEQKNFKQPVLVSIQGATNDPH